MIVLNIIFGKTKQCYKEYTVYGCKLTSSMSLTQIGKAPHISQSHTEPYAGQHILCFVLPFGPVTRLVLFQLVQLLVRQYPVIQARVGDCELHDLSINTMLGRRTVLFLRCK